MRVHGTAPLRVLLGLSLGLTAGVSSHAVAQNETPAVEVASRGPLFIGIRGRDARGADQWVDTSNAAVFQRHIALALRGVTREQALADIARRAGLRLTYSAAVVRLQVPVTLVAEDITVGAALGAVLYDAGVDVLLTENARAALVSRSARALVRPGGAIVGHVTDSATGRGVSHAEVFLENTRWRTATDTLGWYRLAEVDTGSYRLMVRRLGYGKQSRPVSVAERTDTVNVVMKPVATRLDELVTTATGRRRRIDIANDITTINADSVMQAAPIRSVTDLLEGRVPGLTVQHTSGAPGDPSRLRLRGASSPLRSNDPIVIVDGIRVYAEQSAARSGNLAGMNDTTQISKYATPSPLDYIDPNSIETIEVLKGPSASTLYGQDAANGVIVITTKKGRAGPTRWDANLAHRRTRIAGEYPDLLLRWGHLADRNELVPCPNGNETAAVTALDRLACSADSVVQFQLLNDPALTMLGQGRGTTLSLGASGGTAALTYSVTGSYQDESGLPKLPAYEADRYEARVKTGPPDWMRRPQHLKYWSAVSQFGAQLGPTANLSLRTSFSRTSQQRSDLEQQLGTLMSVYLDKASGRYYNSTGSNGPLWSDAFTSGLLTQYFERATDVATSFTNGVNLDWRPRGWLALSGDAGLNINQRADEIFLPRNANPGDTSGFVNVAQGNSVVSTVDLRALSQVPLGRGFQFHFAAGINYAGTSTSDQLLRTVNVAAGTSLMGTVIKGGGRNVRDDATFGWYVAPDIGNNKLNFTTGLRLDSGTGFGSGNSFPNPFTLFTNPVRFFKQSFPKLGFSYLVSDESWFPFKNLVQSLRLRMSYGKASRQPDVMERLRLYSALQSTWTDGQFGDGIFLQTLGNSEVRPEHSTEFEGGFDADLLDNRLTLILTAYRKTTDDALFPTPVAPSVDGGGTIVTNIGKTRNVGMDFTVAAQLLRSGPVTWTTQASLSRRRDVLVELGAGVEPFYIETVSGCDQSLGPLVCGGLRIAPNYPLFGRWSRPILGFADANGDHAIQSNEFVLGDTAVYVGPTVPNYTANFASTVSLARGTVTVNADFAYEDGLAQRNEVMQRLAVFSHGWNDSTASLATQAATNFVQGTDYNWIQVVNTFRFRSLAVAFRMPTIVAHRLGAQQLTVAIQGSNLGLWTNYRGLDPNVNARATGNSVTDTGVLPQPRLWQLQVHATY